MAHTLVFSELAQFPDDWPGEPLCAFRHAGADYVGVRESGGVSSDAAYWSSDLGRVRNALAPPPRSLARALHIDGATEEADGPDLLLRVPDGAPLTIRFNGRADTGSKWYLSPHVAVADPNYDIASSAKGNVAGLPLWEYRIYDGAGGALLDSGTFLHALANGGPSYDGLPSYVQAKTIDALAAGSAVLWVRLAAQGLNAFLPPDAAWILAGMTEEAYRARYQLLTAADLGTSFTASPYLARDTVSGSIVNFYNLNRTNRYIYVAFSYGGAEILSYYNLEYDIGQKPSDPAHPLNLRRAAIVAAGAQKDREEWAAWNGGSPSEDEAGEWSAVKVVVGGGAFAVAPGVIPVPGPALYRLVEGEAVPVAFEPMARTVSTPPVHLEGVFFVSGMRATPDGPVPALWEIGEDGTGTLVAMVPEPLRWSSYWGLERETGARRGDERFLSDVGPVDAGLDADGRLHLLTRRQRFIYEPDAPAIVDRLQPLPALPALHLLPGEPGGQCWRLLKGRGLFWARDEGAGSPGYNLLSTDREPQPVQGVALVGDGAAALQAAFHGPQCAESWLGRLWGIVVISVTATTPEQRLLTWHTGTGWTAAGTVRHAATLYDYQQMCRVGGRLFVWGKAGGDERGIVGANTGRAFYPCDFPYRVRRADRVTLDGDESLYLLARLADEAGIDVTWRVLSTAGVVMNGEMEDPPGPECDSAQCVMDGDPTLQTVLRSFIATGEPFYVIYGVYAEAPQAPGIENLWYRVDSDAPADAWDTYRQSLPWGLTLPLSPQGHRVDVVLLCPDPSQFETVPVMLL